MSSSSLKTSLPYSIALVHHYDSPYATSFLCELDLDKASREHAFETRNAKSLNSVLPGQSGIGPRWSLQIYLNPTVIKLQLWRVTDAATTPPSAIRLRLVSKATGSEWVPIADVCKVTSEITKVQDGFEIAALDSKNDNHGSENDRESSSRRYRLEIMILHDASLYKLGPPALSPAEVMITRNATALHVSRMPHDVKLVFPSATTTAITQYTSEVDEPLPDAAESENGEDSAMVAIDEDDFDDSDNELDDLYFSVAPRSRSLDSSGTRPYRRVTVRALRSSHSTISPSSHCASTMNNISKAPNHPLPVSPKSVYRAAHLLEIPSLSSLALREIQRQLTPEVAVAELFSPAAAKYDELRGIALKYVVRSWAECKDLKEMKEAKEKTKSGEYPHGGAVLVDLLDKLEEKRAGLL
ncbi:hypothetical protein JCM11251_006458 [Rhodosporidiobolus azoricus]